MGRVARALNGLELTGTPSVTLFDRWGFDVEEGSSGHSASWPWSSLAQTDNAMKMSRVKTRRGKESGYATAATTNVLTEGRREILVRRSEGEIRDSEA